MVKGTMRWRSSTQEFGFFAPDDGSREIFVLLSSDTGSNPMQTDRSGGGPRDQAAPHALASSVEVRTQYQRGHWAGGYEIAGIVRTGYHVRRPGSLDVLPAVFIPADVRQAGDRRSP